MSAGGVATTFLAELKLITFGTIHGFRHPLKVLDHIPQERGGTTVQRSSKDGHFSCSDQNILSIDL